MLFTECLKLKLKSETLQSNIIRKNYLFSKMKSQEKSERLFYILNKRELLLFD